MVHNRLSLFLDLLLPTLPLGVALDVLQGEGAWLAQRQRVQKAKAQAERVHAAAHDGGDTRDGDAQRGQDARCSPGLSLAAS